MQFPINIGLRRSRILGRAVVAAHLLAVVLLASMPWTSAVRSGALIGVVISAFFAWRRVAPAIDALRLLAEGRIECRPAGATDFAAANLGAGAIVHPWLTVVRLDLGGRGWTLIVLPDSAAADDFRRLRLWLRCRADLSGAEGSV